MTKPAIEDGVYAEPLWTFAPPQRSVSGTSRRARIELLLPALKAKPREWAAVAESPSKHVVQNVQSLFHRGTFGEPWTWEAACRIDPIRRVHVLYVRFIPSKAAAPAQSVAAPARVAVSPAPVQVKALPATIVMCACGHPSRRHFDGEGICETISCGCTEFRVPR